MEYQSRLQLKLLPANSHIPLTPVHNGAETMPGGEAFIYFTTIGIHFALEVVEVVEVVVAAACWLVLCPASELHILPPCPPSSIMMCSLREQLPSVVLVVLDPIRLSLQGH